MPRNNKKNKNNAKNSNARMQRELQRVLAMERSIVSLVRRVPKGTRRNIARTANEQVRKVAPGLHPIAMKLFHSLTNPIGTTDAYMPSHDALSSMKYTARLRTTIDLSSGDSAVLFPVPALDNETTSFMWAKKTGANWYDDAVNSLQSGLSSYNQAIFSMLPFSRDQIADGIAGKCISYTIKVKYSGTHLYRAGVGISYENPDRPFLDQGHQGTAVSGTTACAVWAPEQVNNPHYARYVNFAQEPEHTFIYHPTLWRTAAIGAANQWVTAAGDSSTEQQPCYPNTERIYFGSSGGTVGCGNAHLTLDNNTSNGISFIIEITAAYEFTGTHAMPYATPSPAGPADAVNTVIQAVRQAKREHVNDPHASFQKIASGLLKRGAAAAVKVAKEGVAQQAEQGTSSNMAIAAGIAGMLL